MGSVVWHEREMSKRPAKEGHEKEEEKEQEDGKTRKGRPGEKEEEEHEEGQRIQEKRLPPFTREGRTLAAIPVPLRWGYRRPHAALSPYLDERPVRASVSSTGFPH